MTQTQPKNTRTGREVLKRSQLAIVWSVSVLLLLQTCGRLSAEPPEPPETISLERMRQHICYLASPERKGRAGVGKVQARDYIVGQFQQSGLSPLFEEKWLQPVPEQGSENGVEFAEGANIGGFVPGTDPTLKDEWLIINAHYDHLGIRNGKIHPGADDNASGVAMLLEVARVIAQHPLKRSVAFIAFDYEESLLWGSRWFIAHSPIALGQIKASFTADMIGRSLGGFNIPLVFVMGAEHSAELREALATVEVPDGLGVAQLGTDMIGTRSDYGPFRDEEIPFLFFSTGEHPDYHSPRDTPDRIDYQKATRISTLILCLMQQLGNQKNAPEWSPPVYAKLEEARMVNQVAAWVLAADDEGRIKLSGFHRMIISQVVSKTDYMLKVQHVSDQERKWVARTGQFLLLTVF